MFFFSNYQNVINTESADSLSGPFQDFAIFKSPNPLITFTVQDGII